jgi:hypothetical protein
MKDMPRREPGFETLLDLDGCILEQDGGFWIKVEAKRIDPSPAVPHGIRYSLTLHDQQGTRVIGYDNAHPVKRPGRFRAAASGLPHDHRHRASARRVVPYEFESPQQLLVDFFAEADRVILEATR